MILTMIEAAELVGVSPLTIRQWVARGHLKPLVPNAKPLLFRESDVLDCSYARRPKTWHTKMDTLSAAWRDACK